MFEPPAMNPSPFPADGDSRTPSRAKALRTRLGALLAVAVVLGAIGGALCYRYEGTADDSSLPNPAVRLLQAVVGGEREERIVFSASPARPATPPDLLPAGVPAIYCFYEIPGVKSPGAPTVSWSRDGKSLGAVPAAAVLVGSQPGTGTITLAAPGGSIGAGVYEVEFRFPESHVMASFVTAVGAEAILDQPTPKAAEVAITTPAFCLGVGSDGRPQKPQKAFYGSQRVFFAFQYDQAEPGSAVEVRWYGGPEQIESAKQEIQLPSVKGWADAWLQAPPPGLPPGTYRAAINMTGDSHELATAEFTVIAAGASPTSGGASSPPPQ